MYKLKCRMLKQVAVVEFEVFTAVIMKSIIFWDMTRRHIPEDDTLQVAVVPIIYVQLLFISLNHTEVSFIYRYYYVLLSLVIILKCIQADIARKGAIDVVQSYVTIYPSLCNYISYSAIISRVYIVVIFRYVLLRYSSMCIMVQLVVVRSLLYYIPCFYYIVIRCLLWYCSVAWMHDVLCKIVCLDLIGLDVNVTRKRHNRKTKNKNIALYKQSPPRLYSLPK
jgi:hypothetical protein